MRALAAALVLLIAPLLANASPVSEADDGAIRSVVQAQLDAFQRDDGGAAFSYASPMIQQMFGGAERFMAMVRQGYAPVYRPQAIEFQDMVTYQGQPTLRVYLVGPDGRAVMAHYMMQQQPDGSWRINGCVLEPLRDLAA